MKAQITFVTNLMLVLLYSACGKNEFVSKQVPDALNGMQKLDNETLFFGFNWLNGKDIDPLAENIAQGDYITIEGWAMDPVGQKLPAKVILSVNGTLFDTQYGLGRDDVAAYFGNPAFKNCGFIANIPRKALPAGLSNIDVKVVGDNNTYISGTPDKVVRIRI